MSSKNTDQVLHYIYTAEKNWTTVINQLLTEEKL